MPLQRWKKIVHAINRDPYAKGRVIYDILNEPDASDLRWEYSSNASSPSVTSNYLSFMDMAHAINPSAPVIRLDMDMRGSTRSRLGPALYTCD